MQLAFKQKGFTLVEIIAVLVILGILAAVAIPKFLDLRKGARISVVKGMQGAILGTAYMVYGKATLAGKTTGAFTIDANSSINIAYGYPATIGDIVNIMSSNEGFSVSGGAYTKDDAPNPATCSATYNPATANTEVSVTIATDGC